MGANDTNFPDPLAQELAALNCAGTLYVALSGGADSTALLLALTELETLPAAGLAAVHVNHGLQAESGRWADHCQILCDRLRVPLHVVEVEPQGSTGDGPEAELRELRYRALAALLTADDVMLTGQHQEDQAETLMLNLLRGSGPDGLASMPFSRSLGDGRLVRPLLRVRRMDLEAFLESRGQDWITDPSNEDTRFDRNYLRHQVMPALRARWPAADTTLARAARHQAEARSLLAAHADQRLSGLTGSEPVLNIATLVEEGPPIVKLCIRHWLNSLGAPSVPVSQMEELCRQLATANPDSATRLEWSGWQLDLFQQQLWLSQLPAIPACPNVSWESGPQLDLGDSVGQLMLSGPSHEILPVDLDVHARQGGERFSQVADAPSRRVKDLLRETGVPPWLRSSIPLLSKDNVTLAIGDWLIHKELNDWLSEQDLKLTWKPRNDSLKWVRKHCRARAVATGVPLG